MPSPRATTASRAWSLIRPAEESARLGSVLATAVGASATLDFRGGRGASAPAVGRGGSYFFGGPVALMNSAKSSMDSASIRGSLG
jgi:hypothetical protein